MKRVLLLALLLVGCRTRLEDAPDLSGPAEPSVDQGAPHDLSAAVDLITGASIDLAGRDFATVMCGTAICNTATEVCVFFNRGDCSRYECHPIPTKCQADRSCSCLGDAFCAGLAMPNETLKCGGVAFPPTVPDEVVCTSNIQCV
jgi:hypothetical protein